MLGFVEIHLLDKTCKRYNLPDIGYPIPLESLVSDNIPFSTLLHGLQQKSIEENSDWMMLEPAMERLADLASPIDNRRVLAAQGDNWWLEIGYVDLDGEVVTIQRDGLVIAAISPLDNGRLRIATLRALDAKSANYLISLGQIHHPKHRDSKSRTNWELAKDNSNGIGNYYASERGEAYLSYWEKGIGRTLDGNVLPEWQRQCDFTVRQAIHVVTELGVYFTAGYMEP